MGLIHDKCVILLVILESSRNTSGLHINPALYPNLDCGHNQTVYEQSSSAELGIGECLRHKSTQKYMHEA